MKVPSLKGRRVEAVVIGASAGGVEALTSVLPSIQRGCAASVFVVLHVPRERPTLLEQIFSARCEAPVREAQDKEPVVPGVIYFAPPDYHLLIDEGPQLALDADELVNFSRPSIDVLFESAADEYGDRLLAILLTGANHDGAAGITAVRGAGGLTVVQDPKTALAPEMPAAALRASEVDEVLTLQEIAALLRQLPSRSEP